MTTLEIVEKSLDELGYAYNHKQGWTMPNQILVNSESGKLIATKIKNHLEKQKAEYKPSPDNIIASMELLKANNNRVYEMGCYNSIKYNPAAKDTFDDLAKLISGENYNAIYPHILRQVVYTIKSKMLGKVVRCPIFAIFYGDGGTGKSTLIRSLCSSLPSHQYAQLKNGDDLVNNGKYTQMLFDNLIIHLDEMSGMGKASIEKLKILVDAQYTSFLRLYENSTTTGFVKATLIGCSNTAVKNILISTDENRKWVQVNFYSRREYDENYCREQITKIENFDYKNIWQSVDESGVEPFSNPDIYTAYLKYVSETCRSSSPTTDWIEQLIEDKGGEWISVQEFYPKFRKEIKDETDSKPMRKDLFYETCAKRGFVKKRKNHDGRYGYQIPKASTPADMILKDEETL